MEKNTFEYLDKQGLVSLVKNFTKITEKLNKNISTLQNEVKQMKQTPAEIKSDMEKGGDFNLTTNLKVEDSIKLTKPTNLDLGNNSIVNETAGKDAFMFAGGNFTIANGVIDNTIGGGSTAGCYLNSSKGTNLTLDNVKVTATYPVYLNNATVQPTCTIKSGTFTSPYDKGVAVYVEKGGKVVIEDGYFTTEGHNSQYLLNLKDNLCPADGSVDPRDYIVVKGGTFVNFDPSNSNGELLKPANFVADGYTVQINVIDEDTTEYTVIPE